MLYAESYNTFETSLTNAKNVVSLDWLYDGLRQFFGKFFLVLLLIVLGLPLVYLFGFWLQTKRKKFRTEMRSTPNVFKDSSNYLLFKKYLNHLESFKPALSKVTRYNMKKVPWPLKYTLGQMQKMSATLLTYTDWLKNRFNSLNQEQFKSQTKEFKFLPEKELWNKRNQAYQYWM